MDCFTYLAPIHQTGSEMTKELEILEDFSGLDVFRRQVSTGVEGLIVAALKRRIEERILQEAEVMIYNLDMVGAASSC